MLIKRRNGLPIFIFFLYIVGEIYKIEIEACYTELLLAYGI